MPVVANGPTMVRARSLDDRGVTPVVAVALLVGIVVLIAAVTGGDVDGLANEVDDPAPQAAFSYAWDNGSRTLTIAHVSGAPYVDGNTGRLTVRIEDDDTGGNDYPVAERDCVGDGASDDPYPLQAGDEFVITGERRGGDIDVERDGTDVANDAQPHLPEIDDEVTISLTSDDGAESYVVSRFTIPRGEDTGTPVP
jgi:FlaG/FlaF family flagellin (archaellin)